eukprot:1731406-Rhodomonas_salina.1
MGGPGLYCNARSTRWGASSADGDLLADDDGSCLVQVPPAKAQLLQGKSPSQPFFKMRHLVQAEPGELRFSPDR